MEVDPWCTSGISLSSQNCFPYSYRHLCSTWICYPGTAERLELKIKCRAEVTEEPSVLKAQITRLRFIFFTRVGCCWWCRPELLGTCAGCDSRGAIPSELFSRGSVPTGRMGAWGVSGPLWRCRIFPFWVIRAYKLLSQWKIKATSDCIFGSLGLATYCLKGRIKSGMEVVLTVRSLSLVAFGEPQHKHT